jgi:hypothetical protein
VKEGEVALLLPLTSLRMGIGAGGEIFGEYGVLSVLLILVWQFETVQQQTVHGVVKALGCLLATLNGVCG